MPLNDERPEGAADDDEPAQGGRRAVADHVDHEHEDEHAEQRLGDRVDGEDERVGPVGLHEPAEAGRGPEGPPLVAPRRPTVRAGSNDRAGPAMGSTAIGPSGGRRAGRAARARRASSARAPMKTTVMTTRIAPRPPAAACRPARVRRRTRAGASRRGPTASGRIEIARPPTKPSRPTGKLRPGHEVDRLDGELGQVIRLAAPGQEQAGQHHPEAVQGGECEQERRQEQAPLDHLELDVEEDRADDQDDGRPDAAHHQPADGHARAGCSSC